MRDIKIINSDWQFTKDSIDIKNLDKENWENISLPHTWNGLDGQDGGSDYHRGLCWYKKIFMLDNVDGEIYIEFEGVNSVANMYLNGEHIGEHKGGFSTFRFNITNQVVSGENTLIVGADNSHIEDIYPLMADFTFCGGIYRDVKLITVGRTHFDLDDYGSSGVFVTQTDTSKDIAKLNFKAKINNVNNSCEALLKVEVQNADGKLNNFILSILEIDAYTKTEAQLNLDIKNPILWHGKSNPYLYNVIFTLSIQGEVIDRIEVKTGLRYYEIKPDKGFYLNGEHIKLKGISRHQDRINIGWALMHKEQDEDMELIKEVGANSIRLAHYQHNQYFYDLCDREGMLVWAEIPYITVTSSTDQKGINAQSQLKELIRQNYNHPSIFCWGVQNEVTIGGNREAVDEIVQALNKIAKNEDPTRLTTQAQVGQCMDDDPINSFTDILAYNKYYGWYYNKVEDFESWIEGFRKINPQTCLGISEYGAEGILDYHSECPKQGDYSEEYHSIYHEKTLQIFNKFDSIWGSYVWNMFDFGSDMRDEGGVKGRNNKGLVTYDRKIKKDAFYWYKANWSDEKFIHLCSKRYKNRHNKRTWFKVYSNLNKITLYLNEKKVETKISDSNVFLFESVKLKKGKNSIKVIAEKDGVIYEDTAMFRRVKNQEPSYLVPKGTSNTFGGEEVENWFKEFESIEMEELNITDDVYSTSSKIEELLDNDEAKAVLEKYLKSMLVHPMLRMIKKMSIDQIREMKEEMFPEKLIYVINKELIQIKRDK